jgi:small-conductance mechanosensitive channel
VLRLGILLLGFFLILETLGVSITPVLTAFGIGGLAVALALQETLANLFAGLYLVASKQVRPGDYIKLDTGDEGYVTDVTWRTTVLTPLPTNNVVIIPNKKFAAATITNYTLPEQKLWVSVEVGVSYASDLTKVEAVTMAVAHEILQDMTGGTPEFAPVVRYHTFAASSINLTVRMLVSEFASQAPITHAFIKRLTQRYKEEGIDMPFPIRTVYLKSNASET